MKTSNKILVAIDFGEQSVHALDYAVYFAKAKNATVVLFTSIENTNFIKRLLKSDEQKQALKKESTDELLKLTEKFADQNVKFEIRVDFGKPYIQLMKLADELEPVFVVMGKTEAPSFTQKLLGSNTRHVINECRYPVVSIRGNENINKVAKADMNFVVPLDLSKEAVEQLTAAVEYGKLFDAQINLLSIITSNSAAEEIQILTRLKKATNLLEEAGVKSTSKMMKKGTSEISKLIMEYAEVVNAELIITMTQQEKNIVDFFIGSTAQEMLNKSTIPVLTVVPWEKQEESIFNHFIDPVGLFS